MPTTGQNILVSRFLKSLSVTEDGTINRRVLGGLVFSDSEKLKRLNSIVWPQIGRLAKERALKVGKLGQCW